MAEITSNKSTVLSDMEFTGALTFKGELNFGGKLIKGSINGGALTVRKSATIEGDIRVETLRVEGAIVGNITALAKCDLGETAAVTGDITSPRIILAEGATLSGQLQIGPGAGSLNVKV